MLGCLAHPKQGYLIGLPRQFRNHATSLCEGDSDDDDDYEVDDDNKLMMIPFPFDLAPVTNSSLLKAGSH